MRILLVSMAFLASSPALANDTGVAVGSTTTAVTSNQAQPSTATAPEEKKICKRIDATESRIASKKLCLTAEQWKKRQSEQMY